MPFCKDSSTHDMRIALFEDKPSAAFLFEPFRPLNLHPCVGTFLQAAAREWLRCPLHHAPFELWTASPPRSGENGRCHNAAAPNQSKETVPC